MRPLALSSAVIWIASLSSFFGVVGCSGGSSPPAGGNSFLATPIAIVPTPAATVADDWVTFAHDVRRTAHQALPTGITTQNVGSLKLKWSYQSGTGSGYQASPIVSNGVVYVVDANGSVSALDAATGKAKWTYKIGEPAAMTPALYDGILFVGSHWQFGHLIALDPATGSVLWSQQLLGGLRGSPVAIDGMLYVPITIGDPPYCEPGGIYKFDERTGAPAAPAWLTEIGPTIDGGAVWSPITYDGSKLYFGTGNTCKSAPSTAQSIVAISPQGQLAWNVQTASPNSDNDVGGGVFLGQGFAYATGKNRNLYAVNLSTGQTAWSQHLGPIAADPHDGLGGIAEPVFADSTLIVSGGYTANPYENTIPGGTLYGVSPQSGAIQWTLKTNFEVKSTAATIPNIAFAELDNTIDALDPATGSVLWSYQTKGDFDAASPAIVPSGLYVADQSGTVYAFALGSGTVSPALRRSWTKAIRGDVQFPPTLPPSFCRI